MREAFFGLSTAWKEGNCIIAVDGRAGIAATLPLEGEKDG